MSKENDISTGAAETEPSDLKDWGHEYEVVRLRFESIPLAYVCFVAVFVWFEVYGRFIQAGLLWAAVGGTLIAVLGIVNAFRGWRKSKSFPALAAMLLTVGILAAIVVPLAVGFMVYFA